MTKKIVARMDENPDWFIAAVMVALFFVIQGLPA
jgi:hypothetical protein